MLNLKNRVDKLSKANLQPLIIVLMPGEELTEAQLLDIAKAEAAGIKPYIIKIGLAKKPEEVNT